MYKKKDSIESKGIIEDIADSFTKIFNIDRFRDIIRNFVVEKYQQGADEIEQELDFNVQFGDQVRDTAKLETYVFDNIQGMTTDMQNKLRQELQRGLLGNETSAQLRQRIGDIFKGDNPTRFKFEERIKIITMTEGKRAANMAKFANAERLNIPLYKYTILHPKNPCPICKVIANQDPIPIKQLFKHGETTEMYPPFHPRCMCGIIITRHKEK